MKFGSGKSWDSQSTPEMKLQAAREFSKSPPAITRKVNHTLEEIERLITSGLDHSQLQQSIISDLLTECHKTEAWRQGDYTSFVDWVEKKWGKSKSWAYEKMRDFAKEFENSFQKVENGDDIKHHTASPLVEAKTGERISFPPEDEEDEKPAVHAATPDQMKRKPDPEPEPLSTKPPMDASGAIIPQHLLAMRERRDEITALETAASKLRALFERLQTDPDMIYGHILASGNIQHFERSASSIRHSLAECLPDIVCPRCEGSNNGKPCEYCCGSGWIAEVRWNREWVKSNGSMEKAYVAKRAKNL